MKRLPGFLAALIALGACLAAAWASQSVFERIPHLEDEFANLWEAEVMARGEISQPSPPFTRSFMVPFVVDYEGLRFGKYPPGWPAALSLGVRLGAPWLVNALLAGASAWLAYRLGSRFGGQGVGVLAALLTATLADVPAVVRLDDVARAERVPHADANAGMAGWGRRGAGWSSNTSRAAGSRCGTSRSGCWRSPAR